jgi:hypothetical protein
MILEGNLINRREIGLKKLIQESLHIRSHIELLFWLQGDFQRYIPHEVMIAAWGDFSLGIIYVDIVSALPGVRTGKICSKSLTALMQSLYKYWLDH